jgi:hypothetical protein
MEISKNQTAFDTVVAHLRLQKKRSAKPGTNVCMYRGPDGTKCAVGVLIPDDQFDPAKESQHVSDLHSTIPALQGIDLDFLCELQRVHDSAVNWDESGFTAWDLLEQTAAQYDLIFPGVRHE